MPRAVFEAAEPVAGALLAGGALAWLSFLYMMVRPRRPHLTLRRSRHACRDIPATSFVESPPAQPGGHPGQGRSHADPCRPTRGSRRPAGRLIRAPPALPGATHDLTVARAGGLLDTLARHDVEILRQQGLQGASGAVRTPLRRHANRPTQGQGRRRPTALTLASALGVRAIATLKTGKALTERRCCPRRTSAPVAAILVLHLMEISRSPR